MEGLHCYNPSHWLQHDGPHATGLSSMPTPKASVIGGYVYHGTAMPA